MEVEFLSNMRYNLLATKKQWNEWLDKLACFHEYYERAVRLTASPLHIPSPSNQAYHSPAPSPTGTMHPAAAANMPVTPTITTTFSPTSSHSQNWNAYQANTVSPLATKPSVSFPVSRKRSPEADLVEHPAKRPAPPRVAPIVATAAAAARLPNAPVEPSRLPVPHLSYGPEQTQPVQTSFANSNGVPQSQQPQSIVTAPQGHVSLPPLQPGVRAMSTVYQPAPAALTQQPGPPVTTCAAMAPTSFTTHVPVSYGTPSKRHSPGSLAPFNSSPLVEHFGQASGVHTPMAHTPIANSPSVYLQQRPSPYKPVRHVNTLLYPPPSASLDQYHLSVPVPPTQMHYQPLGRRNDLRTGIPPGFLVYNRGQQQPVAAQGLRGHYPS